MLVHYANIGKTKHDVSIRYASVTRPASSIPPCCEDDNSLWGSMTITFACAYSIDSSTFGIRFEATVDEERFVCTVSTEALQDVDPTNVQATPEAQFLANRSTFERIAEQKIRDGAKSPVAITSTDVRT